LISGEVENISVNSINSNKPRLLYIVTSGDTGGAQTHVQHLASSFNGEFEVHVIAGSGGAMWSNLQDQGLEAHLCPHLVRSISPWKDVRALFALMGLLKKIDPDLVSTHSSKAGFLGRMAALFCRIPVLFTVHGWSFTEGVSRGRRQLYLMLERAAARLASRIICVSEYDRRLALQHRVGNEEKLVTIRNGIPDLEVAETGSQARTGQNENVFPLRVVMVARFSPQKDQGLVLRAVRELKREFAGEREWTGLPPFEVIFVGDGPLMERYRQLSRRLQLEDLVQFWGSCSDVGAILSSGHIFLLASRWEGLPRSVLEAMRAGLPVIVSRVGGVEEAVEEGKTGFLVPRGDMYALKDRLMQLLREPETREAMGRAGREKYERHFTLDRMLRETREIYYKLVK